MPIVQQVLGFFNSLAQPIAVLKYLQAQKKFLVKNIEPHLASALNRHDGSFDDADADKIMNYYGLAVPAVLGEAFCALRGKPMTQKERLASTCQGAITGLGDDFFDRQRLSAQEIKELIVDPTVVNGKNACESLGLYFYKNVLANVPKPEETQRQIFNVLAAQILSKQQESPGLSYEVLKDITMRKGAESVLYYRTSFDHPLRNGEEKMLYSLGGLMQLSNDIFDIYKDRETGVNTLATTANNIKHLRFYYASLLKLGKEAAYKSGYPRKNIDWFLGILSIGIFSRCFVCLDQLQKNEKRTNGVFAVNAYTRKELICDMDTVSNKLKSLNYHLKISRIKH